MSYSWTSGFTGAKFNSLSATIIEPLPGARSISYLHCSGATFLAGISPYNARVQPGDGITIHNSVSGNNGTYLVVGVPDEEILLVRGTLASEGAGPTLSGAVSDHVLTINDETTTNWETIVTAVNEPAVADRWTPRDAGASDLWAVVVHAFDQVAIHQSGAFDTDWESTREIVTSSSSQGGAWSITNSAGDENINMKLGLLASSDRRSYYKGSTWFMPNFNGVSKSYHIFAHGSTLIGSNINPGEDGQFYGVHFIGLVDYTINSQTNGSEFQDVVQTDSGPIQFLDIVAYSDNIVLGHSPNQSLLIGTAGKVTTISRLAFSDSLYSPYPYRGIFLTFEAKDPQEDFNILDLYEAFVSTEGQKTYTFNPSFVDMARNPVSGATVFMYQFDDSAPATETSVSGSPFRTDANGQINAGSGVVLLVQNTTAAGVKNDYSYHVQVQARGFQFLDYKMKPTQPVESDKPLRLYEPALEGEEATL